MQIDHIVFDIGRVLIHWDREIPYRRLIPDEAERMWFLDNVCSLEWNLEQDRGRPWEAAENQLIELHPGHAENIRSFRRHWTEMIPHHHEAPVQLMLKWISEGKDVTLLTNFATDTFEEAAEKFGFLKSPRGATVSGGIGLVKPDEEIFHHHRISFDLDPEKSLFLDDSEANIHTARRLGWHAIHVRDPQNLPDQVLAFDI